MVNTIKIDSKKTLMIAHRGCSGLEKENSMPSFIAAGQRTYYGMECDIHPTTDGVFVVIHDSDTARVAGKSIIVEKCSYEEIKQIELLDIEGKKNHSYLRIPTLEEYLECCIRYEKRAIIEFKDEFKPEDVNKVLDIIKNYNYLDHCTFISFYFINLVYCRNYDSGLDIQFLSDKLLENELLACQEHKFDLDLYYKLIDSKETLDRLHNMGFKVNVWTVNNKEDGERLSDWGVDFITTNILE